MIFKPLTMVAFNRPPTHDFLLAIVTTFIHGYIVTYLPEF